MRRARIKELRARAQKHHNIVSAKGRNVTSARAPVPQVLREHVAVRGVSVGLPGAPRILRG